VTDIEKSRRFQPRQEDVFNVVGVDAAVARGDCVERDRLSCSGHASGDDRCATACGRIGTLRSVLVRDLLDEPIVQLVLHFAGNSSKLPSGEEGSELGMDSIPESAA
jgi:hypothetical protein